ncbi:MAG: hypothetical protein AB7U46_03265 [Paenirhodobacter sp.]|uniref:hypothetical protein n=1 Tax=Paenirhodobacter sp. TaxID=1965326 RepID=UPI003D09D33E
MQTAYAEEMARQTNTCAMDEKIARFAAWLAPLGVSFTEEDLPRRKRLGREGGAAPLFGCAKFTPRSISSKKKPCFPWSNTPG